MWESHADTDHWRVVKPAPDRARPVYAVSEPTLVSTEQVIAAVISPSVGLADLEAMLKRLLTDVLAQAPPPRSAPTHIEAYVETPAYRNADTGTATTSGDCPQGLVYGIVFLLWPICPQLNVKFLFMLAGWSAEQISDHYAMISPRLAAERLWAGNGD